jgi:hypothetical protein
MSAVVYIAAIVLVVWLWLACVGLAIWWWLLDKRGPEWDEPDWDEEG